MKKYTLKSQKPQPTKDWALSDQLNEEQLAVVTASSGPNLVIAGAGSGKTHTLTYRVAWLIHKGVDPSKILLLTFTNKAARNMTDRVAGLVSHDAKRIWSGTYHSIGNRILRRYAAKMGLPSNFNIIDSEDAASLMDLCVTEAVEDIYAKRIPRGSVLVKILSLCINTQTPVPDLISQKFEHFEGMADIFRNIFALFQTRKLEMGLVDYDDLLLHWKRLLTDFADVREALQAEFEHILVDEYQDTNLIQGEIIDLMSAKYRNLMVVGDDSQAIYGFRGAEYRNILEFGLRYPECRHFKLELNYRSTPQILELANRSIAFNQNQYPKTLRAHRPSGEKPAKLRVRDVYQQADFVAQRILEMADEGVSLDEIAVLYRAHHHAMELQVELTRRGIPYVVRSGIRFFEQAHIKDVLAYLRLLHNPKDELSFIRLAKHFQGVGNKRADQIWKLALNKPDPLRAIASDELLHALPTRVRRSWAHAAALFKELIGTRLTATPDSLVEKVIKGPYDDYLQKSFGDDYKSRAQDLEQLVNFAAQFEDIDRFLGEITLLSSMSGQDILVGGEVPDEKVTLTSIHQAKGLEWHACFVLWLSDGHFPSTNSVDTLEGEEEERRLFYVAATRAKEELYLSHVFTHRTRDNRAVVLRESIFLEELADSPDESQHPFETWILEEV